MPFQRGAFVAFGMVLIFWLGFLLPVLGDVTLDFSRLYEGTTLPCSNDGAKPSFTRLVTFGDSDTDDGSDGGAGFNRYSNGPVWPEYVASALQLELIDVAWGGARTDYGNVNTGNTPLTGFLYQVDNYLPRDVNRTIHTVLIGYNDFYDGVGDPATSVNNILTGLHRLLRKGVRYLLVLNEGPWQYVPACRPEYSNGTCHSYNYASVQAKVAEIGQKFNSILQEKVSQLAETVAPEVSILLFDTYSAVEELRTSGVFRDTSTSWVDVRYQHAFEAQKFMWWDGWHPSAQLHKLLADRILRALSPWTENAALPTARPQASRVSRVVSFGHGMSGDAAQFYQPTRFTRKSDGAVWLEHVAEELVVSPLVFAWDGARTDRGNIFAGPGDVPTGLLAQVEVYNPSPRDAQSSLHTIWAGFNDFWDGAQEAGVNDSVTNIMWAIKELVERGARDVLVLGELPMQHAPLYDPLVAPGQNNPSCEGNYAFLDVGATVGPQITAFNRALEAAIARMALADPGVSLRFFDTASFFEDVVQLGLFANTSYPWYSIRYAHPMDVGNFLWWDLAHPTARFHKLLGEAVLRVLRESWL
eukprot:RCo045725